MKIDPNAKSTKRPKPTKSLTAVVGQTEHVKDLVEESASELSSVNTILKREAEKRDPQPGIEKALDQSEAVEDKVQDASEKLAVVHRALEHEVRERRELEHELAAVTEQADVDHHAAFHDPLTGLPNRALFNDRLKHGIAQAKRHGWRLAVMFLDLDKFKTINDTYGHSVGDDVLKTIAGRLKETSRADDTVSRLGGDEFLCLLMEIGTEQDIKMIAEKIINALQAPCEVGASDLATSVSISASIGISMYPRDGITADALVKSADQAMYHAKRTKSRYSFAAKPG